MEVDPSDNRTSFCEVRLDGFRITELRDVIDFWQGMYRIGNILLKENGFVIYPVVTLKELQSGNDT